MADVGLLRYLATMPNTYLQLIESLMRMTEMMVRSGVDVGKGTAELLGMAIKEMDSKFNSRQRVELTNIFERSKNGDEVKMMVIAKEDIQGLQKQLDRNGVDSFFLNAGGKTVVLFSESQEKLVAKAKENYLLESDFIQELQPLQFIDHYMDDEWVSFKGMDRVELELFRMKANNGENNMKYTIIDNDGKDFEVLVLGKDAKTAEDIIDGVSLDVTSIYGQELRKNIQIHLDNVKVAGQSLESVKKSFVITNGRNIKDRVEVTEQDVKFYKDNKETKTVSLTDPNVDKIFQDHISYYDTPIKSDLENFGQEGFMAVIEAKLPVTDFSGTELSEEQERENAIAAKKWKEKISRKDISKEAISFDDKIEYYKNISSDDRSDRSEVEISL